MSENTKPIVGKYGSLIQKAREPKETENQNTSKQVNQKAGKPESQIKAVAEGETGGKQVNQKASKPASQIEEEMVNLSIKVSKRRRRHWSAEAKRRDTTLVAAISQALSEKFGEPQD